MEVAQNSSSGGTAAAFAAAFENPLTRAAVAAPPAAAPVPPDRMELLAKAMRDAISPFQERTGRGQAPVSIYVGLQPRNFIGPEAKAFSSLMGMSTMSRLFAAIHQLDDEIGPFSLRDTERAHLAFKDEAQLTHKAFTTGMLANFYSQRNATSSSTSVFVKRAELHRTILDCIFADIPQVDQQGEEQLDGVLTELVKELKSFKLKPGKDDVNPFKAVPAQAARPPKVVAEEEEGEEEKPLEDQRTVDFCVVTNYVNALDITGNGKIFMYEPRTRLSYLKMNVEDWMMAVQKSDKIQKDEKFRLRLEWINVDYNLQEARYKATKPNWEPLLKTVAGKDVDMADFLEDFGMVGFGLKTSVLLKAASVVPVGM